MPERVLGGRYRVQGKIGIGGMATVYRGTDEVLGRTVAIKTMLPQYAADPSFAARFKQEAQAAAALQSPYIVGIFDWGKDGDTYYIIMEYLRGTDLKSGIRTHGALDSRKVAQIGSQICQALSVAHKHDIIHRDIKPQNIMVQPDGNIKVMDFGIARAKNSHLTADNSVLGTAHYVSPEQTKGQPLGPTSDIYSLGIVMYEAACGKVPFDGDDAISVALKQVNEQPVPPSQVSPNVDPQLEAIILKCLMKDPAQRFQTADELRRALTDYLAGRVVAISNNATTMLPAAATTRLNKGGQGTQQMNRVASDSKSGDTRIQASMGRNVAPVDDEGPSKGKRVGIILGVIAAIAVLGVALWFLFGQQAGDRSVPNYITMSQDDATKAIKDSDFFQVGTISESYDDNAAEGTVMAQDPESGSMRPKGTRINLTVSKGKRPAQEVTVPDLSNMTPDQAEEALTKLGLVGKAGDSVSDSSIEAGHVARQSPAAGTSAKEGDTVTYNLSKGAESKSVPDVTGYTQESATSTLENAGFNVSVGNSTASDTVPAGSVISYTPSGNQPTGTTISLTISTGRKSVDVPNVDGLNFEEAQSTLENAGLRYSTRWQASTSVAKGQVISHSPSGSQPTGTTVTIIVSAGPDTSSQQPTSPGNAGNNGGTDGTNSED